MAEPVLKIDTLTKDYDTYRAVDAVSFEIGRGQVMGLLGPNGAGKSTTIQMLLGITVQTSGGIEYFGQNFAKHRQACLQRINFVSAYNSLQIRISVKDNLMVFAGLYGVAKPKQKIAELLDYFEIARLANNEYRDLSAGERTRVNLAKSLLNDPELILMDEPTASLDPDIADKTLSLIEELRRDRELSILFTSHNMGEVERICDEVIFLDRGRIVSQDTPRNHTMKLGGAEVVLHYRGARTAVDEALKAMQAEYEFSGRGLVRVKAKRETIAGLIAAVVHAGVAVEDVEVNRPTLEDVFLDVARRER